MINEEIAWLQGVSANVSNSTNMSELQNAMCNSRMPLKPHVMDIKGNDLFHFINGGFDLNANRGFSIWVLN
jgi:hypothetical protein